MALILYVAIPIAFLVIQKYLGLISDGITLFTILIYVQLSYISYIKIYKLGLLYETVVFSVSYMLCYVAAYSLESHDLAYVLIPIFLLSAIDVTLFILDRRNNSGYNLVLVQLNELKKSRLVLAVMISAPFFLVLSLSVPAYYQRIEHAPLIIYVFGFLYGFSFLISKRVAGLYARAKDHT